MKACCCCCCCFHGCSLDDEDDCCCFYFVTNFDSTHSHTQTLSFSLFRVITRVRHLFSLSLCSLSLVCCLFQLILSFLLFPPSYYKFFRFNNFWNLIKKLLVCLWICHLTTAHRSCAIWFGVLMSRSTGKIWCQNSKCQILCENGKIIVLANFNVHQQQR